jgi:hypothetical protein
VAGERPGHSLVVTRALRALSLADPDGWDPWDFLDIVDERTMRKFLGRAGLAASGEKPHALSTFLNEHPLIARVKNRRALMAVLACDSERDAPQGPWKPPAHS